MHIKHLHQKWNYGTYILMIDVEEDYDGDVSKATHTIIDADGNKTIAPVSPYEFSRGCLEFYIDCNMPSKQENGGRNYRWDDLSKLYYSVDFAKQMKTNKGENNAK
tara:strand:+ start:92 stop:409 length:318 start_codon:yes stop_codon:yes gene_type:complete